jgi:Ca2+-binding RTX toxin-like protein
VPLFPAIFPLSSLDGSNGFKIIGVAVGDNSGGSVSFAGDVNNDGYGDLIIGAANADPHGMTSGASYVVFGRAGGFGSSINLSSLNGGNGFKISGNVQLDNSGHSVSSAGDINGDGFDDVIVGATGVGEFDHGASYVIFGRAGGFSANLDVSSLNGNNGFRIVGAGALDLCGASVHTAGDYNGDGYDDLIIGATGVDFSTGVLDAGAAYVIFGHAGGFAASFSLASLNGVNGFKLFGADANHETGNSVSSAGDIDGDGLDDIIIGTARGNRCYVVYGTTSLIPTGFDLRFLERADLGFSFFGGGAFDRVGRSVSGAGDINGDGFDDLIVGAPFAGANSTNTGTTFVIFGSAERPTFNIRVSDLDGSNGFKILGALPGDTSGGSVSAAGDLNGDGFGDILIGAADADPNGSSSGESYIVFGRAAAFGATFRLSALNGINGFKITGEASSDASGTSVSAAGDVNGDGFDDLIIGASGAGGFMDVGASYVIFGHATRAINRTGTEEADVHSGGEFNDRFSGLGGNDLIRSGGGNDIITGGEGNDTLDGGDGDDEISGEGGNDRLLGGADTDVIDGGAGNDVIVVSAGNDDIQGGTGNDTLNFSGFTAGITISMVTGTFTHPNGTDVQILTSIENVTGGSGNDVINGDGTVNRLSGSGGNDVIDGGASADILNGGTGRDTLTGGADADIFVFQGKSSSPAGSKRDTITDFIIKETSDSAFVDRIDLSAIDANEALLGNNAFSFIKLAAFSAPGQVRVIQSGANAIIEINTSGTSTPEMEIVLANFTASTLTEFDFIL